MAKIKILHLVQDLKIGGLEKTVYYIVKGLDEDKFSQHVCTITSAGRIAEDLKDKGFQVDVMGIKNYHNPINILKLAKFIGKARPDIVHTHGYFAGVAGRIAANLAGIKIIFHSVLSTYINFKLRNILIERILSKVTDRIVCCSEAVRNFVVDYEKIPFQKTEVIYPAIEEGAFHIQYDKEETRKEFNLGFHDKAVAVVSSLTKIKGHKYLIKALPAAIKEVPDLKLLIIGDGVLRNSLENLVRELELENHVAFTGIREDIARILSAIDLFVLPSAIREGFGIAILEAMFASKPIIASRIGGIPELVDDGVNGLLVPPKDSGALAAAMTLLLKDKEKIQRMAEKSLQIAQKKFSFRKFVERMSSLYAQSLN